MLLCFPPVSALVLNALFAAVLIISVASDSDRRSEGVFERLKGFKPDGNVMQTLFASEIGCGLRCLTNETCRSYNIHSGSSHDNMICQLSSHTRLSSPDNLRRSLGSTYYGKAHIRFSSCKDILKNGYSEGNLEYWIDPAMNGNFIKVFCDMTTDGGGWLLIANLVVDDSPPLGWTAETSYRGISNYRNKRMGITRTALKELRTHLQFTQLRFHCSKQQGRTFHVITAANSSGEAVVQWFSGQTDVQPDACGSVFKMEDDNSFLAMQCSRWGHDGSSYYVGKWGFSQKNDHMMYYHTAFVGGYVHWNAAHRGRVECDDFMAEGKEYFNLTAGDFWRIYVR